MAQPVVCLKRSWWKSGAETRIGLGSRPRGYDRGQWVPQAHHNNRRGRRLYKVLGEHAARAKEATLAQEPTADTVLRGTKRMRSHKQKLEATDKGGAGPFFP